MQNSPQSTNHNKLFYPIRYENIDISSSAIFTVAAENNFLSVRAEHWECIKPIVPAHFFKAVATDISNIHVERKTSFIFVVAAKNNMLAVREKIGCPIRLPIISNLFCVASVGIGNPYFHICWCH